MPSNPQHTPQTGASSNSGESPRTSGTSEKQIRANRENAKKSTGPRTPEGKARSAQNARTHGIFVSRIEPIQDGNFMEEPEEFYDRVDRLVRSMNPRDAVELEVATRRAGILIKLERLDRWSALSISGAAIMKPEDLRTGARSEVRARVMASTAHQLAEYFSDPDSVADPEFEVMAAFVRFQGPEPNISIDNFWDDKNTPSDPDEWCRAFEALTGALWASLEEAASWAVSTSVRLWQEFERVEFLEERIAADRILSGPFELQLKYEARLLNSLRIISREYEALQKRDLGVE